MSTLLRIAQAASALGALAGSGYYLLCLKSARGFLRDTRCDPTPAEPVRMGRPPDSVSAGHPPPVSILKPLRGADPSMYESFRSHCLQDYPEYELIFGAGEGGDPALGLVERLQREFPARAIRAIVCPRRLGTNTKVSNLAQMLPLARYEHLVVNDSDIRVERDYLRRIMAPFAEARVGMVTCLYRGVAGATLGSRLESLGISTDFAAGVLAARQLEGVRFGLGSTLAFSRRALDAIGGFEPLADYLADDYELGKRIADAGFDLHLSDVVVDHHLPDYSASGFLEHQLRWARGIRDSRPGGYAGMVLTFGLPWALAALGLSRGAPWAWGLLGVTGALRAAVALVVGERVLHDSELRRHLPLLPLRDVIAVGVWAASFAGHTVTWRGEKFVLDNGKLRAIPP